MQWKYRECEFSESRTTTALGQSHNVFSLAVWHSQPITPKRCLCLFSEKNKTKDNTLQRLAFFCERGGIFPHRDHLPKKWDPQRDPLLGLGAFNPSVPASRGALAMLPCAAQAGRWDFGECSLCCPLREGPFRRSLLQDCFSISYVLLNWRKNLQF